MRRPEVPRPPIIPESRPSNDPPNGLDDGRKVFPCRDWDSAACGVGDALRHRQAGLPVAVQKRVQVRAGDAEDFGPLAVGPTGMRADVLCELFHAATVTHCDNLVKGGV